MKIFGIKEILYTYNGIKYILKAEQKIQNYKQLQKANIYNYKTKIKNNLYYTKGTFSKKDIDIGFEKGYFLDNKFYMINCTSNSKYGKIKAKEAIYFKNKIIFKEIYIIKNKKAYKKFSYTIDLKKG